MDGRKGVRSVFEIHWERGWPSDKTLCDSMRWWIIDGTLAHISFLLSVN
jgi:hypothetical protein